MKKIFSVAFCLLMLCSLLLLLNIGIATAGNPAYSFLEYGGVTPSVIDGAWTTTDEWTDLPIIDMSGNAKFSCGISDFTNLNVQILIEIFNDNTNDTGDYWQICIDPDNSSGTAPGVGDFKFEITGHTTLTAYQGTGTGWQVLTIPAGEITWANAIVATPLGSTPHWILEFQFPKANSVTPDTPQPPNGIRFAAYDASNTAAGVRAWPPGSSADVPNQYGVIPTFSQDPIPETLSFGVVIALSATAVIIATLGLRKRTKR